VQSIYSKHIVLKLLLTVLLLGALSSCSLYVSFTFDFAPKKLSIPQGGSGTVTVTITQKSGLNFTPVTVSLLNTPPGVAANPVEANVNGGAPLIILVNNEAVTGTYFIEFGADRVYEGGPQKLELTVLPKNP
jgi:hypothetical protein